MRVNAQYVLLGICRGECNRYVYGTYNTYRTVAYRVAVVSRSHPNKKEIKNQTGLSFFSPRPATVVASDWELKDLTMIILAETIGSAGDLQWSIVAWSGFRAQ